MTVTPWGDAARLKSRRMRRVRGVTEAEIARQQRERIFGGMVIAIAEHGYEQTRVADVLEASGVSRTTFYRHFDSKLDCFLATIEAILSAAMERVAAAYRRGNDWNSRLGAAFQEMTDLVVSQPAAARLCLVEAHAAGPSAVDIVDCHADELERMVVRAFRCSPERKGMPRPLIRAGLGGLRKIARTRLRRGTERELIDLAPDLLQWALCYRPPPRPLRKPRAPLELPDGSTGVNPDAPRERILAGFDSAVAEKGYPNTTLADVARHAEISLTTFYANFDSKEQAMLASLQRATQRAMMATLPPYQAAEDWPHAIGAALHALFSFMASEPAMAMLGGINAYAGGTKVLEARDQVNEASLAFLGRGYKEHPDANPAAAEAIGASVDALLFDGLRTLGACGVYQLAPHATYLTLVPFLGPERACAVANAGGAPSAAATATAARQAAGHRPRKPHRSDRVAARR